MVIRLFKKQSLYYGNGSNGNYGFIDNNGQLYAGDNSFVNSTSDALNNLRSKSKGEELVNYLMNSKDNVQVVKALSSQTNSAAPNGKYIIWDPNNI